MPTERELSARRVGALSLAVAPRALAASLLLAAAASLGLVTAALAADPVDDLLDEAAGTLDSAVDAIAPAVEPAAEVVDLIAPVVTPVVEPVGAEIETVVETVAPLVEPLEPVVGPVAERIGPAVDLIQPADVVSPILGPIRHILEPPGPVVGVLPPLAGATPIEPDQPPTGADVLLGASATGSPSADGPLTHAVPVAPALEPPVTQASPATNGRSATPIGVVTTILRALDGSTALAAAAGSGLAAAILLAIGLVGPPSWTASPFAVPPRPRGRSVRLLVPPG